MPERDPRAAGLLTRIVREVAEEWAAEGRPLLVPPDVPVDVEEENRRDVEFWDEVDRRCRQLGGSCSDG